ncbi:hypothetical protein TNCV_4139041 [Trichonephila clavipes]|nr:hypothetical protein TNCV_4139041 [Trichonephila clavipes]
MPFDVQVNRWEGVDGLQFVSQEYPTRALLDSNPVKAYCGTFYVEKIDKKIEGKVKNENEPVDQFEAFIEQLNDKLSEFWDLENLGIEAEVSDEETIDNDIMSEFEVGNFIPK